MRVSPIQNLIQKLWAILKGRERTLFTLIQLNTGVKTARYQTGMEIFRILVYVNNFKVLCQNYARLVKNYKQGIYCLPYYTEKPTVCYPKLHALCMIAFEVFE